MTSDKTLETDINDVQDVMSDFDGKIVQLAYDGSLNDEDFDKLTDECSKLLQKIQLNLDLISNYLGTNLQFAIPSDFFLKHPVEILHKNKELLDELVPKLNLEIDRLKRLAIARNLVHEDSSTIRHAASFDETTGVIKIDEVKLMNPIEPDTDEYAFCLAMFAVKPGVPVPLEVLFQTMTGNDLSYPTEKSEYQTVYTAMRGINEKVGRVGIKQRLFSPVNRQYRRNY